MLGAGSWGTALAVLLAHKGLEVSLWARRAEMAGQLAQERENSLYLPGVSLPPSLIPTAHLEEALEGVQVILFVVPSHGFRHVARRVGRVLAGNSGVEALVSATKGIENETLSLMTDILVQELPTWAKEAVAALSGPSFAKEVARGMPTAVTIAAATPLLSRRLRELFSTNSFRAYSSQDLVGVQLGGAVKNVLAIAAGISDGMGFGANTRAALITRGLAEMARLGGALGGDPLTFSGLAGLGDLVLTSTGDLSRNRRVGLELGRGRRIEEILADMRMVAEGVKNTQSVQRLAEAHGVEMPITACVYRILYEDYDPRAAVAELMARPLKEEEGLLGG